MHWPSLLLTLVLILGHALVVRALLNLAFRFGMPHAAWKAVCLVALLVGVAVPTYFVREVGLRGPKVLKRGDWSRVDGLWLGYGGVCAAALLLVPGANLLRGRRRGAALSRASQVSHARDLPERLPVGTGPAAFLARVPGNELLRVEVAEQQLAVPGLPPAWDGLSILHLSDLHFNGSPDRAFFEWALARGAAMKPDLVALTGDILDRHALADWLPSTLGQFRAPLGCYFVLGNHDAYDDPARIRAAVAALGWTDVGGTHVVRDVGPHRGGDGGGRSGSLLIAGTEVPWLGAHPDIDGASGAALRVLLSHGPHHFGWARDRGFDLVLAGHLHGGQIRLPLLGSVCGGRYEAGTFQLGRTVMHVSRGLGQIAPLRFGCPPEITKLVLRAGNGG